MHSLKVSTLVACFASILAVTGTWAGDGFKIPNLNPFSKKATSQSEPAAFSLVDKTPKSQPKKPGLMTQMTNGTRKAFDSTVDFLNPWDKKSKMPATRPPVTGSQRVISGSSLGAAKEEKKGNWWSRMFGPKTEPSAPQTANDFLGQPRLTY
jgi:hypothetical protein